MKENLKTTHYADGTPLIDGTGIDDISGDFVTKYYFAYNDSEIYTETYGRLYTWAAVMNEASSSDANPSGVQGICPQGWHVPSDNEWKELEMYLGMSQSEANDIYWRGTNEGGKLKEAGTVHWCSPNNGATNESGFTALPGGFRLSSGAYFGVTFEAIFWSSTQCDNSSAWDRRLYYGNANTYRNPDYDMATARSVRCIKD